MPAGTDDLGGGGCVGVFEEVGRGVLLGEGVYGVLKGWAAEVDVAGAGELGLGFWGVVVRRRVWWERRARRSWFVQRWQIILVRFYGRLGV